ncbi:putative glycolipid-binding domain-containing protein [Jeotgalibacillus campisalis]|uniref:Glycolipid-binding domain-containing protein n=1 Tax=Jeotgalibacillus campisalis TaxID=220754 RepID=A0A0C2RN90_9BACL|nr:putative glycolipid-binding domain-containing protein [Jeotgalibacillus campisalis]KIL43254.1 hypothetical protein KR50_36570 [Jeotgalibacillus campisalis]
MKKIIWKNLETKCREEAYLTQTDTAIRFKSTVYGSEDSSPITYDLQLDRHWETKRVEINNGEKTLTLSSNGRGSWLKDGESLEDMKGAVDIDISATPFSNSLPINRFFWEAGQKRKLEVLYIEMPALTCEKVEQMYTFTGEQGGKRSFLYQCRDYETTIFVDQDGLVVEYPEAFKRI